jgi:UDPglucose 6-dehydrogenase
MNDSPAREVKTKTVGIVGYGHVGRSMHSLFPEARIYDPYVKGYEDREAIQGTSVAFVCVPTPTAEAGGADTAVVDEVVSWLESDIIVIKSTVPPGTTDHLARKHSKVLVFSPEYIGEGVAFTNGTLTAQNWPFVIVGGDADAAEQVLDLHARVLGATKTYRQTSAIAAELCKYMENTWLALQVVFASEFQNLAKATGVPYWELRDLWGLDPRVSTTHTVVTADEQGFGGRCLPKDTEAIATFAERAGVSVPLIHAIRQSNAHQRARSKP